MNRSHPITQGILRFLGVLASLFVLLVIVLAALGLPLVESLRLLASGAFGDSYGIARTLIKMTPLLLCGLGMVLAWRAGMYNIGGEGQFLVGALAGAWLFAKVPIPSPLLMTLTILIMGVVGGALWAWLAAWLFVKRGVQVVISTILLNFVALRFVEWAVRGPVQETKRQLPISQSLPDSVAFQELVPQTGLHPGVLIAVVVAVLIAIYLFRTVGGYRLRLVGENPSAARANRIDAGKVQIRAMLMSGGLCGLAGAVEYVGVSQQVGDGFAQNWGFMAIPVALLGDLNPFGVIFSSLYFGALFAGSENLSRFSASGPTVVLVMQGIAVLAFVGLREWSKRRGRIVTTEEAL
ncbi:MAG: ABC transporter permease [Fimbriimonadaceae bacterium]|nr:ABC transporter permease [Fimbriimonadaceae bacterium]